MVPPHILQTTIIRGEGPFVDARESRRKVRYVVVKQLDGATEEIPAVSAHHVAAIVQRSGGHFSGWDVYNYLAHKGDRPPKCAERLPRDMKILRYCDYAATRTASEGE